MYERSLGNSRRAAWRLKGQDSAGLWEPPSCPFSGVEPSLVLVPGFSGTAAEAGLVRGSSDGQPGLTGGGLKGGDLRA